MKTYTYMFLCSALLLTACSDTGNKSSKQASKAKEVEQNIIQRNLPVHNDFFGITNIGSINIAHKLFNGIIAAGIDPVVVCDYV